MNLGLVGGEKDCCPGRKVGAGIGTPGWGVGGGEGGRGAFRSGDCSLLMIADIILANGQKMI